MKINVPPIKSQGIKTKLIPYIHSIIPKNFDGVWIEPFMGTGAVAFNVAPRHAILCDTNPHLINFYQSLSNNEITPDIVKKFLNYEGQKLLEIGEKHYYTIRERFNKHSDPLDFLFLNRAGFNGMIRFNRKGGLNTPFCRKPNRFARAYITKITNQVTHAHRIIQTKKLHLNANIFLKLFQKVIIMLLFIATPLILTDIQIIIMAGIKRMRKNYTMIYQKLIASLFYLLGIIMTIGIMNI